MGSGKLGTQNWRRRGLRWQPWRSLIPGMALMAMAWGMSVRAQMTEQEDVTSLKELKAALGNPKALSNWEGDPCIDKWVGVQCERFTKVNEPDKIGVLVLWLNNLSLQGPLPESIFTMPTLQWLSLGNNSLIGTLPTPKKPSNLVYLDLSSNHLSGNIVLANILHLHTLILSENDFTGIIPGSQLAELKSLKLLKLGGNDLSGSIPKELESFTYLESLCLNDNQLSGSVPRALADLPNLKELALQNNKLSGSIASKFAEIKAEVYGNPELCRETAEGCIPLSSLSGTVKIPIESRESVPGPNLNGTIPAIACERFVTRICHCDDGRQGSETCDDGLAWTKCACDIYTIPQDHKDKVLPWWSILFVVVAGLFTTVIFLVLCICVSQRVQKGTGSGGYKRGASVMDFPSPRDSDTSSRRFEDGIISMKGIEPAPVERKPTAMALARSWGRSITLRFSHEDQGEEVSEAYPTAEVVSAVAMPSWPNTPRSLDIHQLTFEQIRVATNNFDVQNVLGTDGVARVYRAVLPDKRLAVVKELEFLGTGRNTPEKFREEMTMFHQLEHQNLVQMIGFCAEEDSRLVVFEYVQNGSLDVHLHAVEMEPCMDWNTRMYVLLGSARGLEFLHDLEPPLVHKELRSTNVLLDDNYDAKLSDYGLTHLAGQPSAPPTLSATVNVEVAAGIAAPELAWAQEFTPEMDVYAFGVLLLEVITGRWPLDTKRPANEQALVRWARPRLTERSSVEGMVDWRLEGEYSSPALYQVALLAWQCIQKAPESRPNMTQVVEVLEKVQNLPMDSTMEHVSAQERLHEFMEGEDVDDTESNTTVTVEGGELWAPDVEVAIPVEDELVTSRSSSMAEGGASGTGEWGTFRRSKTMERGTTSFGPGSYERVLSAPIAPKEIDFPPRRSLTRK